MAGSSTLENLELFSIIDATADAWFKIYAAIYHEKNPDRKVNLLTSIFTIQLRGNFYHIHSTGCFAKESP